MHTGVLWTGKKLFTIEQSFNKKNYKILAIKLKIFTFFCDNLERKSDEKFYLFCGNWC